VLRGVKFATAELTDFFAVQRPFLKPGYTLKDLSQDIAVPLHHLSAFINQYYGIHFNEFLNRYRVIHFKERIAHEEWKVKKLKAIAMESGFNNRNTFTIAFKKISGQSPSEYMRSLHTKK
jgi:YesN/AraC family two-component response regulator